MKRIFYNLIYEIENYKIYHIILVFTIAFIIIFLNSFYYIRQELETVANQNRILASKEIEYTIALWFNERINTMESGVSYLSQQNILQDENTFKSFIEVLLHSNHDFDVIQALFPKYYIYFNSTKIHDYRDNPTYIYEPTKQDPLKLAWYEKTKNELKTTITTVKKHVNLLEQAMLICSPAINKEQFEGVLCGAFKTQSLFKKINTLTFPSNTYYFISDTKGNILSTGSKFNYLNDKIENILKVHISDKEVQKITTEDDILTLTKLKDFDWYIGVGILKKDIMHESAGKVTSQAIVLFLSFILLIIISNAAHAFLQKRIERKQKEYEYMLAHRSRISEVGKLILSINHQLKQPLNSLRLIISTTLDSLQRKTLDQQILESNLELCQKSISLMDRTIGIFRNFYRSNEEIVEFSLLESIQNVLHVNYTELSYHNITIVIQDPMAQATIQIRSHENYIQQILLVLIQNAKDALINNTEVKPGSMQKIYLYIYAEYGKISIDIEDWGQGVSTEMESMLFSEFKISKKYNGSGIGLYFAHKLACEKLKGDLNLVNCFAPTRFRFSFEQYLS